MGYVSVLSSSTITENEEKYGNKETYRSCSGRDLDDATCWRTCERVHITGLSELRWTRDKGGYKKNEKLN